MTADPFHHKRRRTRTALQKAAIFVERGGCCHLCSRRLGPADKWDLDHIIPLSKGGTDDDDNLAPACSWCHGKKTKADAGTVAKGKRAFAKHIGAKDDRPRGFRGWRTFSREIRYAKR